MDGQEDGEIEFGLLLCHGDSKIQFTASTNHVLQHLVDRVLILAGPTRDLSSYFTAKPIEKGGRTWPIRMAGQVGEKSLEIRVILRLALDAVMPSLSFVVFSKGFLEIGERVNFFMRGDGRGDASEVVHEAIDISELFQNGPATVSLFP